MSTSNLHQELKQSYKVPEGEENFVHVLFIKILKEGKRTRDVPSVRKYKTLREWNGMKKNIEELGIAVTAFDEFSILHDPTEKPVKVKAEVKTSSKSKPE
jgi:hypothetical protein